MIFVFRTVDKQDAWTIVLEMFGLGIQPGDFWDPTRWFAMICWRAQTPRTSLSSRLGLTFQPALLWIKPAPLPLPHITWYCATSLPYPIDLWTFMDFVWQRVYLNTWRMYVYTFWKLFMCQYTCMWIRACLSSILVVCEHSVCDFLCLINIDEFWPNID